MLRVDGDRVGRVERLVKPAAHGHRRNQNPFLFRVPETGSVGLVYYSGGADVAELRVKIAPDPPSLAGVESHMLVRTGKTIAAPACCVDPVSGDILLFAEREANGRWETIHYRLNSFPARVPADSYEVLHADDVACPFLFVRDETLYLGLARRLKAGIIHRWVGELHRYRR